MYIQTGPSGDVVSHILMVFQLDCNYMYYISQDAITISDFGVALVYHRYRQCMPANQFSYWSKGSVSVCSVHNVNLKWHPLVFKWENLWFVWNIMSRSSQLVVNTSPSDFMIDWWLHKRTITWGLHNFSSFFCVVLVWVFLFVRGFSPTRELFPHMETSQLPVKGCKFLYTCTFIFQTALHFASAVWKVHTTIII